MEDFFDIFNINKENPIHLNIDQTNEKYLYHYTNVQGILGILQNKCFWVSKSDYLNDSSEIIYMKDIISEVFNTFQKNPNLFFNKADHNGDFFKLIINGIKQIEDQFITASENNLYEIYILSFTEFEDSLILFSNYSNYDGYNLGLNRAKFLDFEGPTHNFKKYNDYTLITAGRVNYDKSRQVSILVKDILEMYNSLIENLLKMGNKHISSSFATELLDKTLDYIYFRTIFYSMFFKNPSFWPEHEYRVIFIVDKSRPKEFVHFRTLKSILVPYIEIKFEELPLYSITIGPTNKMDVAYKSLKYFLDSNGYSNILLSKSNIPLRY